MRECGVREGFINEKDLLVLFGNLDEILEFNSQFLKRLTNECSRRLLTGQRPGSYAVAVAECFLSHFAPSGQVETEGSIGAVALNGVPRTNSSLADNSAAATGGVKVYAHYCTNYPRSLQVLSRLVQPESRSCALLAKLQLGLGHRMQLGSYLLKPVQRILKYPLLLDAMRHYEKDYPGWPGQELIERALRAMQRIANRINEIKKLDEDAVRVQEVQSFLQGWTGNDLTTYGGLVAEERVMCQKKHLMHIFLFEKMLLITKRKRKTPNLLWYAQHIFTNDLMVNENRVIMGDCSFQVLSKSNRAITFVFETTGRERKKLWCDRLNKIILESLNISPEQRSRILENLRMQRNLSKQQQQQQQQSKIHKKASRGLDSLKKATNILHRNRRASMDSNGISQQTKKTDSIEVTKQAAVQQTSQDLPLSVGYTVHTSSQHPRVHGPSKEVHEVRARSRGGRTSSKSWKSGLSFRVRYYNQQRRYHSQIDLREIIASVESRASPAMGSMQRSASVPRWMDLGALGARLDASNVGKSHAFAEASRGRQWQHMLFNMSSRLRASLMSSDSACSSTTHSTGDHRCRDRCPLRPASMDSALFYGANSDGSEVEVGEEEELESNNSSGSFYERNFEMSCRDEIFRDSAIFSEDTISQLSTEIAACQRDRNVSLAQKDDGAKLGSIERTESGFTEEDDAGDQKTVDKSQKVK
ncbi:pleckstrin homology domain-containing family G member 3-like isoform X2 [Varroa destructor]|nr:pleckstrin homology domain-containing family G member 3-like isoform X2 [Varroa destructor]